MSNVYIGVYIYYILYVGGTVRVHIGHILRRFAVCEAARAITRLRLFTTAGVDNVFMAYGYGAVDRQVRD